MARPEGPTEIWLAMLGAEVVIAINRPFLTPYTQLCEVKRVDVAENREAWLQLILKSNLSCSSCLGEASGAFYEGKKGKQLMSL